MNDIKSDTSQFPREEIFPVQIRCMTIGGNDKSKTEQEELSGLCRLTMVSVGGDDVKERGGSNQENSKEQVVLNAIQISVLSAAATAATTTTGSNQLLSWMETFLCSTLRREWKMDSQNDDQDNLLVWNRLKQYILIDKGDEMVDETKTSAHDFGSVDNNRAETKRIHVEWKFIRKGTLDDVAPLLLETKQGRVGGLMRQLWKTALPLSRQPLFHPLVMDGMLSQLQYWKSLHRQMSWKLQQSFHALENWKQTTQTLEEKWHLEKRRLLQNFLILYNTKQDQIQQLQGQVNQFEKERITLLNTSHSEPLQQPHDSSSYSRDQDSKALQAQVPNDDEIAVDRITAMETRKRPTGTSSSTTQKIIKKRRNQATGAIEYLDEDALFQDKTLFPDHHDHHQSSQRRRQAAAAAATTSKSATSKSATSKSATSKSQSDDSATDEDTEYVDKDARQEILATLAALERK